MPHQKVWDWNRVEYRRDIDGLRAIAVLSVMLFHAKVPFFNGGFVGVDIFFVISGFLITGIIFGELDAGRFSIIKFYERRVRRIIPALLFMIAISIALFYPFMLPDDLENLGQSIVATIAFANNILLSLTAGYFEQSTELKPMAHTWSLGVEEQYYVVMPIIMMIAHRFGGRRAVIRSIAVISIASLAFALIESRINQSLNFYLTLSRFWELGAGSFAFFVKNRDWGLGKTAKSLLASFGLVAVLSSIMIFGGRQSNPDEMTLIPILGACLLLLFSGPGTWVWPLLSNRLAVGVGLISYSLYLWHQPLYVLLRLTSLEEPMALDYLPYAAAAFVLAIISWRFIERPFRDKQRFSRNWVFAAAAMGSAAVFAVGLTFHLTSGFYNRWPELAAGDRDFGANQNMAFNLGPHRYANKLLPVEQRDFNVVVLGNSFARDAINVLNQDPGFVKLNYSYSEIADYCDLAEIRTKTRPLVANARFVIFGSGVNEKTISCVKQAMGILGGDGSHDFIVFGTKNFGWNNNSVMRLDAPQRYQYRTKVRPFIVTENEQGKRSFPSNTYVDLLAAMGMGPEGRVPVFSPDGKFMSQDCEHLTKAGAHTIAALIQNHPALAEMRKAATTRQ